ncbi:hypothetical protein H1C71_004244, partial [Ictidomys tridecemlineatus]
CKLDSPRISSWLLLPSFEDIRILLLHSSKVDSYDTDCPEFPEASVQTRRALLISPVSGASATFSSSYWFLQLYSLQTAIGDSPALVKSTALCCQPRKGALQIHTVLVWVERHKVEWWPD